MQPASPVTFVTCEVTKAAFVNGVVGGAVVPKYTVVFPGSFVSKSMSIELPTKLAVWMLVITGPVQSDVKL